MVHECSIWRVLISFDAKLLPLEGSEDPDQEHGGFVMERWVLEVSADRASDVAQAWIKEQVRAGTAVVKDFNGKDRKVEEANHLATQWTHGYGGVLVPGQIGDDE